MRDRSPDCLLKWTEPVGWARSCLESMHKAGFFRPWGNDPDRLRHEIRVTTEGITVSSSRSKTHLPFTAIEYVEFWEKRTAHGTFAGIQIITKEPDASDYALDTADRIPPLTELLTKRGIAVHDGR